MTPLTSLHKVQVLLKANADDNSFARLVIGAYRPAGINERAAIRVPQEPSLSKGPTDGDRSRSDVDGSFDAMLDVVSDTPDWESMSTVIRQHLTEIGTRVDLETSAVSAGTEWTLVPGGGESDDTILLYPMRRLPSLTLQQFHDYWLNVHSRFGIENANLAGYRQFHIDNAISTQINAELGLGIDDFDGVAEAFMASVEPFQTIDTDSSNNAEDVPPFTHTVLEDETRFIDLTRSAETPTSLGARSAPSSRYEYRLIGSTRK